LIDLIENYKADHSPPDLFGGTAHLPPNKGRTDISLDLSAHPSLGVLLTRTKLNNRERQDYVSKGDLRRLRKVVHSRHGTPLPVGLFVPYEVAWKALKEFLETDGRLPTSIEWINDLDLPPDTFPDPAHETRQDEKRGSR